MSFRLVKPDRIWLDVPVQIPDGNQGQCRIQVKYLSMMDRRAFLGRINEERMADSEIASDLISDWSGVADAEGHDVAFTPDNLTQAMNIPFVHEAIRDALNRHLLGDGWLDLAKNFVPPVVNGRPAASRT